MSDIDLRACLNVMAGLTSDGLNRFEEAAKIAEGDARAALPALLERIAEGDISCDCDECGEWDGLDRRCSCGNRRVAWLWSHGAWTSDTY